MKRTKPKPGYTHRDKSYWSELLSGQAESGQRVKQYCQAQGVSASSFYRWQKLLGSDSALGKGFNAIEIKGPTALGVLVELPGGVCLSFSTLPPVDYLHRLSERFQSGAGC
jgi:hypothetical protein